MDNIFNPNLNAGILYIVWILIRKTRYFFYLLKHKNILSKLTKYHKIWKCTIDYLKSDRKRWDSIQKKNKTKPTFLKTSRTHAILPKLWKEIGIWASAIILGMFFRTSIGSKCQSNWSNKSLTSLNPPFTRSPHSQKKYSILNVKNIP